MTHQAKSAYPTRPYTVRAEVLRRLLQGEHLTGMGAVVCASTTRLAAVIHVLRRDYGWTIEHTDLAAGTRDGRVAFIRSYYLARETIRRAFDEGAMLFCRGVVPARAKARRAAPAAAAKAERLNRVRDLFDSGESYGH